MTRERSIVRVATWPFTAVSAGLLVGAPAGFASDQGIFLDLNRALQNAAEMSTRRSFSPPNPEVLTQKSPGHETDFALLGVVIAGETRLALVQLAAASSGRPELLRVGGSVAGYRLTDVEERQVTLEGQRGERMILRLQIGGGVGGDVAPSGTADQGETPKPADSSEVGWRESVGAKEDRSARRAERDRQEKVRALMELGVSNEPSKLPPVSTE